jgi:DNA-binding MarR family transcriptional regulator
MTTEIAKLLHEIMRLFRAELKAASSGTYPNLTLSQYEVIEAVSQTGGIGAIALAGMLKRDKSQITKVVRELEAERLIARDRSDRDRRAIILTLTDDGDAVSNFFSSTRHTLIEAMLTTISGEQRDQLFEMLQQMLKNLKL